MLTALSSSCVGIRGAGILSSFTQQEEYKGDPPLNGVLFTNISIGGFKAERFLVSFSSISPKMYESGCLDPEEYDVFNSTTFSILRTIDELTREVISTF